MKVVTIKDVAARAGVSPKTVSRVINGEQHVRAEIREHVMRVVDELAYKPNAFARGLSSSRSFLIGLFVDDPFSGYAADLQRGAIDQCRMYSHHLVIEAVERERPDWLAQIDATLRELRLSGAILAAPVCDWSEVLELFESHDIPVVRLSPATDPGRAQQVQIDDRAAAREMTERLIALGHRDIAFVRGHTAHGAAALRWQGFADACADAGITIPARRVLQGDFSFKSGLAAGEAILADDDRPTAIFASNDKMAFGVLMVAMRHGIAVPGALSIAGFDDDEISRMAWPQLTTINQPNAEMAKVAVDLLIGNNPQVKKEPGESVELSYSLVERESSGPVMNGMA
ncbi:LacI family transcriptional regulator [Novosphingobium sp. PhB165]|uniref:LacI family DNA-binding transcriptional regulator n=1 Tax=Novosphingobium sp. PhB165 TaxID=2485105 RepID=UPI00105197DC|nr:LacI family DNA-binding transcriptional regulator [Novosphingobium sp. PhB165]TCM20534.1 LacI family transcriptional regulator [Novosphingobium sp. PhB165]